MNFSQEVVQARLTELADQTKRDRAFLDLLSSEEAIPQEVISSSKIYGSYSTPTQRLMTGELSHASHFQLAKNRFRLPKLTHGVAGASASQRIGIICDEFLFKSFVGLADFVPVTPENYRNLTDLDVLLVVSTWRGIDGVSWLGVAQRNGEKQTLLIEKVIPHFRKLDIPVVFYSKEDPPNYQHFLPVAKHADVIFTSAQEMIPRYLKDCPGVSNVDVLPFGVNPLHHSPIGHRFGTDGVIPFAGSWFQEKYKSRGTWGSVLFDGVIRSENHELLIFDRNSGLKRDRYRFPAKYQGAVLPAIAHDELLEMLRLSDIAINLNSVQNSMSMFANRAVELQATGTFILSNYNAGLNSLYPHIHLANTSIDVKSTLDSLNLDVLRGIQAEGIRSVFTSDLTHFRIDDILRSVGFSTQERSLRVAALAETVDDQLLQDLSHQSFGPVEVLTSEDILAKQDDLDVILDVSTDLRYEHHYVQDIVNAFHYTDSLTVQKVVGSTKETDQLSHRYTTEIAREGTEAHFVGRPQVEPNGQNYVLDNLQIRDRGQSKVVLQDHVDERLFSVVVPIYNNGRHLEHKCFASLRRSTMFNNMEIIFVDDGSTDSSTHEVIDRLAATYKNVVVHKFPAGGSGSASRPRNKGLELATADYITYLDPDNEALNDGFTRLWVQLQRDGSDFALGNMSRWRSGHRISKYVNIVRSRLGISKQHTSVDLSSNSLIQLGFTPMSIQATMSRTSWLKGLGITQPVGAVGQDSFFFQQMFYYAEKISLVDTVIHTYYGEVADSVVNTVSAKFFEKYLPLETARSKWLDDIGLLNDYKKARLEPFLKGWYLQKLPLVSPEEQQRATETVVKLGMMYGDYQWSDPVVIDFWQDQGKLTELEAQQLKEAASRNDH